MRAHFMLAATLLAGCAQLFGIGDVEYDPGVPPACTANCEPGPDAGGDGPTDEGPLVVPSSHEVVGRLETTGLDIDVPADTVFDTSTDCTAGAALGACAPVAREGLSELCVCRSDKLVIHGLEVRGTRGLVILARESVKVLGALTVQPGAGSSSEVVSGTAGGSFGTRGGGSSLPVTGTATLIPLLGGGRGGGNGGGVGGGVLQVTANDVIRVDATISTPGQGGTRTGCMPTSGTKTGTGAGSGGAILLEARDVMVTVALASNGGGGSSGAFTHNALHNCGAAGSDGLPELATGAPGGVGYSTVGVPCNTPFHAGNGGRGSAGDGDGAAGTKGVGTLETGTCDGYLAWDGGAGGGAGRIRINTATGSCGCTTTTSPTASLGFVEIE